MTQEDTQFLVVAGSALAIPWVIEPAANTSGTVTTWPVSKPASDHPRRTVIATVSQFGSVPTKGEAADWLAAGEQATFEIDDELQAEFDLWDRASSADFAAFEAGL